MLPKTALSELRNLPVPKLIEADPFALKERYVAEFERITGRNLFASQPEMYVIETMAYAHSLFASSAQNGFMQNRAIWAQGNHLDEIGANVDTFRLGEEFAVCQVEFTLLAAQSINIFIPSGTRVSSSNSIIFETESDLVIEAGDVSGLVLVIAQIAGADANGLGIGKINQILDSVAYVSNCSNIIVSDGGADVESDDSFRHRIINSFERISKAGSLAGYVQIVKSASALVIDVGVVKPQAGYIDIYLLTAFGVSSDALDNIIIEALDPETIVPMGDYITVKKAISVPLDIVLEVRISNASSSIENDIRNVVTEVFDNWSRLLGVRISPAKIISVTKNIAGVIDVSAPDFAYMDLAKNEFITLNSLTINLVDSPNV